MILGPCKHNVICCDALQSAAVLTLHQGEQAGCVKAEREMWSIHFRSPDDTQMSLLQILKRALRVCLLSHRHTDFSDSCTQPHFKRLTEIVFHALRKPLQYMNTVLHQMLAHRHPCALHDFPA